MRLNKTQKLMMELSINNYLASHKYENVDISLLDDKDKLDITISIALKSEKIIDDYIRRALTRNKWKNN